MLRRWGWAIAVYAAIDLVLSVLLGPRLLAKVRPIPTLPPIPIPYSTLVTPMTMPPTEAPLPCSRYVHPDPLQCKEAKR